MLCLAEEDISIALKAALANEGYVELPAGPKHEWPGIAPLDAR